MKKAKKWRLSGIPAWALSILTLVATIICFIIPSDLDMKRELAGQSSIYIGHFKLQEMIYFIVFFIITPIIVFLICRAHPKSIWYAPVICNAVGFGICCVVIVDSIYSPGDVTLLDWIIWGGSSVLTVTGAIIGARIGRHRIDNTSK